VHLLRKRWGVRTVKINGDAANPPRWPDGTHSVQGAASALGITAQTVFDWLRNGRLAGRQLAKGQPWQIAMSDDQISALRVQVRRTSRSKQEAS
jgi:transposase-like protein